MTISDAFLKIAIGANVKPGDPNLSGMTSVGLDLHDKPTDIKQVLGARIIFSTAAQTAEFSASTGAIAAGAGQVQVESTVVILSGAVTTGNLALTLTGSLIAGSPLAISVPLVASQHSTAELVAQAIATKLKTLPAVTNFYEVAAVGSAVVLTSIFALANDATLNLAITAGLGVTGDATSDSTQVGIQGVLITRAGGDGKDIYGNPWDGCTEISALVVAARLPGTAEVSTTRISEVAAGETIALKYGGIGPGLELFTASGAAIIDVVAFCK